MGSPFNLDSFLADIDERFDLDNDQVQDQDQAAANENNNAELADVANDAAGRTGPGPRHRDQHRGR